MNKDFIQVSANTGHSDFQKVIFQISTKGLRLLRDAMIVTDSVDLLSATYIKFCFTCVSGKCPPSQANTKTCSASSPFDLWTVLSAFRGGFG